MPTVPFSKLLGRAQKGITSSQSSHFVPRIDLRFSLYLGSIRLLTFSFHDPARIQIILGKVQRQKIEYAGIQQTNIAMLFAFAEGKFESFNKCVRLSLGEITGKGKFRCKSEK